MTWTWTFTKMGIGIGLGAISSNPVGWAVGIPTATLIRLKNEESLNSSTLTLNDKEDAQRWIEVATDYQWGAGIGMIGGAIISTATKEMAKETLSLGRQASKEIAKEGFKTELARSLITDSQFISTTEKIIKAIPGLHQTEELIKGAGKVIKDLWNSNKEDFINNANALVQAQFLLIDRIESNLNKEKNLLNPVKENILALNKANVKFFIKYENNKEGHRLINRRINEILTRIKLLQLELHNNSNCCENVGFAKYDN